MSSEMPRTSPGRLVLRGPQPEIMIIVDLEERATSKRPVTQELLRAARDCLPRVFASQADSRALHCAQFTEHLETAQRLLDGGPAHRPNYDPAFPLPPRNSYGPSQPLESPATGSLTILPIR